MDFDPVILLVSWALLLVGLASGAAAAILSFKRWQTTLRFEQAEPVRAGSGIDVSLITPSVRRVRRDYVRALHTRPHPLFHPAYLLNAARGALKNFSYFRARDWESEKAPQQQQAH